MSELLKRFESMCTGKKNKRLNIFNTTINPGESISLALPLPEILGYAPFYMPVKVIHGKTEGPCLLVFATMRGDEFNGMEIIKRLMNLNTLQKVKGTIIAVPVLNVYGMLNRSKFLPDGNTLDNSFPGKESGDYASRLTNLFMKEIFSHCHCCLEFCSGQLNHNTLPHVYTDLTYGMNKELAKSFKVSVISEMKPQKGHIQYEAAQRDIPMLTYKAGEAMRFNERSIKLGIRGTMSLLRKMSMLPEPKKQRETKEAKEAAPIISEESNWIFTPISGIAHNYKKLGDRVKKNEVVSIISEPLGSFKEVSVKAPYEGVIVGGNDMPLVFEGEALLRIATFEKLDQAAETLQDWTEESKEEDEEKEEKEEK